MSRSKVAVLRVDPERILDDIDRLFGLADVADRGGHVQVGRRAQAWVAVHLR